MWGMTPAYDVSVGGSSILGRLGGRAMSITVTDNAGSESDTLDLEIEAGDKLVEVPKKGTLITCALGYAETGLTPMGLYTADDPTVNFWPITISVSAKAASMRDSLKEHRTQRYENKTLGAIIDEVAGRNGLAAAISSDLAARLIPYVGQTEESDLHLVSRLARAHGAIAAPKNGKLLFVKRGEGKSATGQGMPVLTLTPTMCTQASLQMPDRPAVKEVRAHWHDRGKAERKTETAEAGGKDSGFTLRHDFPSQDEAQWAAEAKASELKASGGSFSATLAGNAQICAETVVKTRGFYPGCDFTWVIKTATHTMDASSFTTAIECELKP